MQNWKWCANVDQLELHRAVIYKSVQTNVNIKVRTKSNDFLGQYTKINIDVSVYIFFYWSPLHGYTNFGEFFFFCIV